jgi:tetratricopeptide (TPR) repeat protein
LTKERGSVIPECPYPREIPPSKPHEPARACALPQGIASANKEEMPRKIVEKICVIVLVLAASGGFARAQAPVPRPRPQAAPTTAATIDLNEAMFTTMCALYAAGYESDINPDTWSSFRSQMKERLRRQQGPAVDALKEFYRGHQFKDPAAMLSRYVWFGMVSGPAPKFQPVLRRDELPPDVLELEGFSAILAEYYREQKIGALWREVQPLYNREVERLHDPVSQTLFQATAYLRVVVDPAVPRTFSVIVEPLVGRITNVRSFGDHYAIILSGSEEIPMDVVRHAYLHFLLDPLPQQNAHVLAVKRPIYEMAAKAPRLAPDLKDDFPSWFGECTVRAVELKLKRMSPSEREVALQTNDVDGYALVRPLFVALAGYEKAEPTFRDYFPDLVRGIDAKTEQARVAAIQFAPAPTESEAKELSSEALARRRARVSTLPSDEEAIDELTEGEKRIAEKNPRAAEASFLSVLSKYPDQTRAWYGLGLVALLDHDAEKAKEVFGRLTAGAHAASNDPMVMAWSHVYLARILEDEGQLEKAKSEYQAVLGVQGAPAQAQQAAQKGLGDLDSRKPSERP